MRFKNIVMDLHNFLNLVRQKKQTITSIILVVVLLVSVATFVQPLKYGSTSRLLVVQNLPIGTDPYAISRSNEMITNVLAEVLESDSFYNQVINSEYNIDRSYFRKDNDSRKEMKKWASTVEAKALKDRGMIDIKVYHPNRYQVNQIAQAINQVYQTKNSNYHGLGNMVSIKVINKPYVSNWPVKPNIVLNYVLGILFAIMISLVYIYLFPEERYDIRLWPKRKLKQDVDYGYIASESAPVYADNNEVVKENIQEELNGLEDVLAEEPVEFKESASGIENVLKNNYVDEAQGAKNINEEDLKQIDLEDEEVGVENNNYLQRGGDIKNVID